MQLALTLGRSRSLAYFNLRVVDVRQQLVEVAHVEPFSAARALHEMISLGFGHAVSRKDRCNAATSTKSRGDLW
jgi:hypothetical protein